MKQISTTATEDNSKSTPLQTATATQKPRQQQHRQQNYQGQ